MTLTAAALASLSAAAQAHQSNNAIDEITADEYGLLVACEKGALKAVKIILNQYREYYKDIDRRFLGPNGVKIFILKQDILFFTESIL